LSAAIVASAATIVLAGIGALTAAQSAPRMEVRKIVDNVYVVHARRGRAIRCSS
jgi:hypothetical protein